MVASSSPSRRFQPPPLEAGIRKEEGWESKEKREGGPRTFSPSVPRLQPALSLSPGTDYPASPAPQSSDARRPQAPPLRALSPHCPCPQPPTAPRPQPPVRCRPELPAPYSPLPQAPPASLLTGGPRSRCRGSRRPARGSRAAARLRPGRGRENRWPAPTRRGSSTPRAEGEPASSCAAACGDPESRAGRQRGAHQRRDRTRCPHPEKSERAGERAEPGSELKVSGGRPRLSRAAFSNSARWALRRQKGRGAFSLTLGGPGPWRWQWPQSWGSDPAGGPRSRKP